MSNTEEINKPEASQDASRKLSLKDAFDLYENGKHRRYTLLFSVNAGAFAVAKIFTEHCNKEGVKGVNVLGGLSLQWLSFGMVLFTLVMVYDIYKFGMGRRTEPTPDVFAPPGRRVLGAIGGLICIGWLLVGFGNYQCCKCDPPPTNTQVPTSVPSPQPSARTSDSP